MQILKIDFERKNDERVDLKKPKNLELIRKYILPIICKNKGWGSESLTEEIFDNDPEAQQQEIDNTLEWNNHAATWVAMEEEEPVGLLSVIKQRLNPKESAYAKIIFEMLEDRGSKHWRFFISRMILTEEVIEKYRRMAEGLLNNKIMYFSLGIVLRPDKQSKGEGIADRLYRLLDDGIKMGWTSNPIIVYKRKKMFPKTFFLPWLSERVESLDQFIVSILVYADLITAEDGSWDEMPFGSQKSIYFVKDRGAEYLDLAQSLFDKQKISADDFERLTYVLGRQSTAGAIVSF